MGLVFFRFFFLDELTGEGVGLCHGVATTLLVIAIGTEDQGVARGRESEDAFRGGELTGSLLLQIDDIGPNVPGVRTTFDKKQLWVAWYETHLVSSGNLSESNLHRAVAHFRPTLLGKGIRGEEGIYTTCLPLVEPQGSDICRIIL